MAIAMAQSTNVPKRHSLAICFSVYIVTAVSVAYYAWSVQDWLKGDPSGKTQFVSTSTSSQVYFFTEIFVLVLCGLLIADACCRTFRRRLGRRRFAMKTLILI